MSRLVRSASPLVLPSPTELDAASPAAFAGGVRLVRCAHPAGHVVPEHGHDVPHLCLPLAGCWCEHCATGSVVLERGQAILHHAGAPHATITGATPCRCLHLEFTGTWRARIDAMRTATGPSVVRHDVRLLEVIGALTGEVAAADDFAAAAAEVLLEKLLVAFEAPPPARRRLSAPAGRASGGRARARLAGAALRVLRERHREPLTMRDVAGSLGVEPETLTRAVRQSLGFTPGEVLRRYRAHSALVLLRDRPRAVSLATIAAETGFADQSHMTRTVRRLHGRTPGDVRREALATPSGQSRSRPADGGRARSA